MIVFCKLCNEFLSRGCHNAHFRVSPRRPHAQLDRTIALGGVEGWDTVAVDTHDATEGAELKPPREEVGVER
jgi:hypothetical protein